MKPIKPMLAKDGKCSDAFKAEAIKQRKFDGTRTYIIKDGQKTQLIGARQWKNDYAKNHPGLAAEARKLPMKKGILDCELTFFKKGTDDDVFLTALAKESTMKKEGVDPPKLMCFDILQLNGANVTKLPYKERDKLLETVIPKKLRRIEKIESTLDGKKALTDTESREGIVVKDPDCKYEIGKRSKCMLKVKNWLSDEAVVAGYTQGLGAKAPTFGAVVLGQYDKNGKLQYVGKAAGFTNEESKEMLQKMNKLKTNTPTVSNAKGEVKAWVKPKIVVEVKYLQRTNNGVLRHPDFMRERPDKPLSEVALQIGKQRRLACGHKP